MIPFSRQLLSLIDGFGIYGTYFHYGVVITLVGSAFIIFFYLLYKKRLDMDEEPKFQMMQESLLDDHFLALSELADRLECDEFIAIAMDEEIYGKDVALIKPEVVSQRGLLQTMQEDGEK